MDDDLATVRTAGREDLPELLRLTRAFYDEDGFATTDAELERNLRSLLGAPDAHTAVALAGRRYCGFALTTARMILESGVVAELQDLYVAPEFRRRGVGADLIANAEQWAREFGAVLLEVVIAPNGRDVSHLLDFYSARGFDDRGRRLLSRPL